MTKEDIEGLKKIIKIERVREKMRPPIKQSLFNQKLAGRAYNRFTEQEKAEFIKRAKEVIEKAAEELKVLEILLQKND